jgi:hypothetical protein
MWRRLLILVAISAPSLASDGLPVFSFMGFNAGEIIPSARLKGCTKGVDRTCIVPLVKIANVYGGYMVTTHNDKLSTLYIDAHPNSFDDLKAAFTAKYGAPCENATTPWRNALGANFDNPTLRWCFSTGKLVFQRYGQTVEKMNIFYEDEINKPDVKPPAINF